MRIPSRFLSRLVSVLMLAFLGAAQAPSIATKPISRLDTPWWRERFQAKQLELKNREIDLVWLGDSITQDWEHDGPQPWQRFAPIWKRFYGDRHAIDLGFRGDSTCHLLWRLDHGELDGIHPRAVILLIGANNFGHIHTDAQQTYAGILVILETLHRRLPATQILLIGVLPSIRSKWVTDNTNSLNRRLERLPASTGNWFHYVDVSSIFEQHGHVDASRFLDPYLRPPDPPLHPTPDSQAAIAAKIEPIVATMMHDHLHQ